MSINNLNTYLNIKDSHLRVVSGNVYAQAMNIGGINVETAHGLQSVSNTGNVTSNTLQFSNAITGFVTTANAQIGRDLIVSGNTTVSTDLTVSANATVADTLTISEHVIASKEATVTGNLHVTTIRSDSNVVAEYTGPHDRPLRKYPEVALTSASQGGYVVTRSSENTSSGHYAWELFDNISTTKWLATSVDSYSTTSPFLYNGSNNSSVIDVTNTPHNGAWVKLQLPVSIKLSHVIQRDNDDPSNRVPGVVTFLGSNNGSEWTFLKEFTGLSNAFVTETMYVNSTVAYSHYAYVVKNLSDADGQLDLGELEYYGYEEGSGSLDTTLKSVYNVPATTGTQLEVYYDGQDYTADTDFDQANEVLDKSGNNLHGSQTGGVGFDSTYKAFTFDGTGDYILTSSLSNFTDTGKYSISLWIKIPNYSTRQQVIYQFGHGIAGESFGLDLTNGVLTSFVFLQTNNLSSTGTKHIQNNWFHYTNTFDSDGTRSNMYINGVLDSSTSAMGLATIPSNPYLILGSLFIGDDPTAPTPAGVHPNLHFDGSIANFRLYSKALNADQVKELYDYQKDYFLGSKSQVTLYKGHLGVGVTEPSGQLELAGDERIQEYPPGPMSGYETLIPGHGVFCASASSTYSSYYPWEAFEHVDSDLGWHSLLSVDPFSGTNNAYSGSSALGSYTGAYLKLKLPYKIELKSFSVRNRSDGSTNGNSSPEDFKIIGSNDETNWEELFSISGVVWASTQINKIYSITSNPKTYRYLAFVCTRTVADTSVIIGHIKLFGTPGPTTLDKGSLTLGRSLDVPRISRYDVDTETPRPEKLLIDYDTTVNSSLTDISGQGNHGVFKGTNMNYSSADKAFVFNGTDDVIHNNLPSELVGDPTLTISMWVNPITLATASGNYDTFIHIGKNSQDDQIQLAYYGFDGSHLQIGGYGQGMKTNDASAVPIGQWTHLCAVITPGAWSATTKKLYINGEFFPTTLSGGGTSSIPTGSTTSRLVFGGVVNGSGGYTHHANIKMSNPKIYNVALEPSEVKKLYNLGRTGRSMVISDTAVGIGKAPEAQLDVRGNLNVDGVITTPQRPVFYAYHAANGGATHGGSGFTHYTANGYTGIIRFKDTKINVGNCFNTSDYKFYAPITGYYWFEFTALAREGSANGAMELTLFKNGANAAQRSFAYTYVLGASDHDFLAIHIPLFCNAGDNIYPAIKACSAGVNLYFGEELGHFSGYFIG